MPGPQSRRNNSQDTRMFSKMSSGMYFYVANDRFNLMCPSNHIFYLIWG